MYLQGKETNRKESPKMEFLYFLIQYVIQSV